MTINVLCYPPGAAGNHLKNIAELDGSFQDQWPWAWTRENRVGLRPYDDPQGLPGEVHSLPGRNIHDVFVEQIERVPMARYLIHGHFGELAAHAGAIRTWTDVTWLLVTMDHPQDRMLLRQRQHRLGYHPYWLDEEQLYLYRPDMYVTYFGAADNKIHSLSVSQIWQEHIVDSGVVRTLQSAFGVTIDPIKAQQLHTKWCALNFGSTQG